MKSYHLKCPCWLQINKNIWIWETIHACMKRFLNFWGLVSVRKCWDQRYCAYRGGILRPSCENTVTVFWCVLSEDTVLGCQVTFCLSPISQHYATKPIYDPIFLPFQKRFMKYYLPILIYTILFRLLNKGKRGPGCIEPTAPTLKLKYCNDAKRQFFEW